MADMKDMTDAPSTPPYFNLRAGHRFDMDQQRNILLNFIHSKGLDKECDEFIDKHFPRDKDCD